MDFFLLQLCFFCTWPPCGMDGCLMTSIHPSIRVGKNSWHVPPHAWCPMETGNAGKIYDWYFGYISAAWHSLFQWLRWCSCILGVWTHPTGYFFLYLLYSNLDPFVNGSQLVLLLITLMVVNGVFAQSTLSLFSFLDPPLYVYHNIRPYLTIIIPIIRWKDS